MGERGRALRNSMVGTIVVLVNAVIYRANNVAHAAGLVSGALLRFEIAKAVT